MGDLKIPIEIDNYQPLREVVFEALRGAMSLSHSGAG